MHLLTIVILAIATNLDNLCVGISYGLSGKKLSLAQNIIISAVSGILSAAVCAGAEVLGEITGDFANRAGSALLITIGLYCIFECLLKPQGKSAPPRMAQTHWGTLALGAILAINGVSAALGAGLSEVSAIPLGIAITAFSALFIALGAWLGNRLGSQKNERWLGVISGLLLLGIGIWEFIV